MSGKVYCGRLPTTATEKDLENLLKAFGKVREVDFKEGYAYVLFKDYRDADRAVLALNNTDFLGGKILVERAKELRNGVGGYTAAGGYTARTRHMGPPVRSDYRVRVENLSTRAKWLELKEYMNNAGEVCFADTHRRRPGEGVVEFSSEEDMKRAIQSLDRTEFYGKRIRLIAETPRSGRSMSRSPSYSRQRSRSRSESQKKSPSRSSPRRRSNSQSRSHKRRSRSWSCSGRSTSRSRTNKKRSRSRSTSCSKKHRSRSHSPSRRKSRSHRKPHKPHRKSPSKSRSRSRSRSKTKKRYKSKRQSHSPSQSPRKTHKKRRRSRSRS